MTFIKYLIRNVRMNLRTGSSIVINYHLRNLNRELRKARKQSFRTLIDDIEDIRSKWILFGIQLNVVSQKKRIRTEVEKFQWIREKIKVALNHRKQVRKLNRECGLDYEYD